MVSNYLTLQLIKTHYYRVRDVRWNPLLSRQFKKSHYNYKCSIANKIISLQYLIPNLVGFKTCSHIRPKIYRITYSCSSQ